MKENFGENGLGFNSVEEVAGFYESKTSWEILGVSSNASADEIKKAYRSISKKYHPDNYANDPVKFKIAEEIFKYITNANDEISSKKNKEDINLQNNSSKDEDRGFRESDLEYDAPFVDDITDELYHRSPDFSNPDSYKSRLDKLSEKYKGNKSKEEKIPILVDKAINERIFLSSIEGWLFGKLFSSEQEQDVPEEFKELINKWFKIGLDKNKIFKNDEINSLILKHLADSSMYGPKKFSHDYKNWLETGMPLKDFLDSDKLKGMIDDQVANVGKYDKKRSEQRKAEWVECLKLLKK